MMVALYDDALSLQEPVCDEMTRDLMSRMGCSPEAAELCGLAVGSQSLGNVCFGPLDDAACAVLRDAPAVACLDDGATDDRRPFVLHRGLLYSRRNWRYERTVRDRVATMASMEPSAAVAVPCDGPFKGMEECQRRAVEMMCRNRFSLLTGGPGTGKTFTIARAVKLCLEQGSMRLGLAAPTGKAAARVKEAMLKEAEVLGLEEIPSASTIHSLLEPKHDFVSFKRNRDNPLPLDWLIVDESSMIDLPLMAKLLDALPEGCRLTLVGDENQLASVEPGRVFGDLCRMDGVAKCELDVSRRFPQGGEIHRLAAAVNGKLPSEALAMLKDPDNELIHYEELVENDSDRPRLWGSFVSVAMDHFAEFSRQNTPEKALEHLNDCRILCVMRNGHYGVNRINSFMKTLLGDASPLPMMITRNDSSLGVRNGDVGVVMPKDNHLYVIGDDGRPRRLRLSLLPDIEMAFASTIHKAQGSEYKDVVIVVPPSPRLPDSSADNPLLTREILYTAITRTQKQVFLYGGDASIVRCCNSEIRRRTGLAV